MLFCHIFYKNWKENKVRDAYYKITPDQNLEIMKL